MIAMFTRVLEFLGEDFKIGDKKEEKKSKKRKEEKNCRVSAMNWTL